MKSTILIFGLTVAVEAHVGAFTTGMYCRGGNDPASENRNTNLVVNPLYNLSKSKWWMQADRGCDKVPPPEGEFLDLPAGGSFTAELAINRAFTSLSYDGEFATDWPDGLDHPEDWAGPDAKSCLMDNPDGEGGALHTKSQEASAGTAWAISYAEDLASVTMENLVVFSVLEQHVSKSTPWKRLATYDVPADLPVCPEQGCYCAWLWIPDGCGEPNMYMQNFRCRVTNSTSTKSLGTAQVPVPCADDPSTCVSGPKQMIAWNQAEGNNVGEIGFSPAYNSKLGFLPGAQNDIFVDGNEGGSPSNVPADSPSSSVSPSTEASTTPTTTLPAVSDVSPAASSDASEVFSSAAATSSNIVATQVPEATPGSPSCRSKKLRRRHNRRHGGLVRH